MPNSISQYSSSTTANTNGLTEDDPEQELWRGGFSARSMVGAWIGASLISGLVIYAVTNIAPLRESSPVWLTGIGLVSTVWLSLLAVVAYRKLGQHYEISSQRLKHRSGVLIRQMDRIELIDIDDVSYRQGPLQAILNVGTIELLSSDTSHPKLNLRGIANVSSVANLIDDARRAERKKRGLYVESI
ncbi:MAG: PH domain-containing protein [Mariniblastus sp.]